MKAAGLPVFPEDVMVELLVIGAVGMAFVVIVPLLIIKAALGLLVGLITLPFKLVGALLGGIVGLAGALLGGVVAVVCVALCIPLLLLAVPLIPLFVIGLGVCLVLKGGIAVLA